MFSKSNTKTSDISLTTKSERLLSSINIIVLQTNIMITFCFILFIVFAIYKCSKPDKKSAKKIEENNAAIAELPDFYLSAHELSSTERAMNLWPSDKDMLQEFQYTKSNKCIFIKMKDGRSICCPLSDLSVSFSKVNPFYRIEVKYKSMNFSFYNYPVFSDKEYEVIYNTLTLAGTTYGVEIMGSTYKTLTKVNAVLKVIKILAENI